MHRAIVVALLHVIFSVSTSYSQSLSYAPGSIRQQLEKLNVLGSVLYVAAHPDDENTRLITFMANEKLMRTAYLSATRGDGGQNLIGSEIREGLGVIRTQELLAARRTDGGEQFFSRANDFGYSKSAEETFTIWDRDQVLADFVWVIRKFRPDIMITRFNSEGRNHGHHTASAILAKEAFELAADSDAFPEQLADVDVWQPSKIFWNIGWWRLRNSSSDTSALKSVNAGGYNPLLGASYGEIAARSRSMHKSQGFGSAGRRGDQVEYLQQWGGEETPDPFDGIDATWTRVAGAEKVAFHIQRAIDQYDESKPWAIVDELLSAKVALQKIEDAFWKEVKTAEIEDLVVAITGLYVSVTSDDHYYAPGDSIMLEIESINRSPSNVVLKSIHLNTSHNPVQYEASLLNNKVFNAEISFLLPGSLPYANPYWLEGDATLGMYEVSDQLQRGKPENDPAIRAQVAMTIEGEPLQLEVPVMFRKTDPVKGEVVEPVAIGPPVTMNMSNSVLVFESKEAKDVELRLIAGRANVSGQLTLEVPKGWSVSPASVSFELLQKGQEQMHTFQVVPPNGASQGMIAAKATVNKKEYSKGKSVIEYDHIPRQIIFPEAEVRVVKLDLQKRGELIGYIEGAGDAIPSNLAQIGYRVDLLQKDDVVASNLEKYDAIVLGVRAFNTVDWLAFKNKELFEYARKGGTLVVQYNTNRRLVTTEVAPFDLNISRDRVTVEGAPVELLAADHPVLNTPNRITAADFDGWVQERGLYFPDKWADEFTPILSSQDPGESPKNGGLLVAPYGEGYYIYTGYSWFRELPAGVPGAYRLFVNLISLGNE